MITFAHIASTGSHENSYGNGELSLEIFRPNGGVRYTCIAKLPYSSPTADQLLNMQTSPNYSEGSKELGNMERSLSRKQAEYIMMLTTEALREKLNCYIPPDDEIDELMKNRPK